MSIKTTNFYLLICIFICLTFGGCTLASTVLAISKSTDQFISYPGDPRVFYEPGAESQAKIAAAALSQGIRAIEQAQYRPFVLPVQVYLCASIDSFKQYGANERAGGFVLGKRLFISPKPENTEERLPRILVHELSHLHLSQQLGVLGYARLPFWFTEGLAVYASGGGGAENVNEDQARVAISEGKNFLPETGSLLSPKYPHYYRLEPHMFYRQASMFVSYMRKIDELKFKAFLLAIENGRDFTSSFEGAYEVSIDAIWQQFIVEQRAQLKS